jgi:hypothetical protein
MNLRLVVVAFGSPESTSQTRGRRGTSVLSLAPGLKPGYFAYNPDHPRRSQEA